ncbi:MAG: DUF1648 domain-containing protein [Pseudolabrys sp.]
MNRASLAIFVSLLVVFSFLTLNSIGDLPEKIAIHFDTNGAADGWTTQETYRFYVLLSLVGLPLLLVWVMAGLPRLTKGRGQIPDCEYWFADDRQRTTKAFLLQHSCWLGILTVAVIYGMHISIMRANAANPPLLATDRLLTMILFYLIGLVWWAAAFLRHFKNRQIDEGPHPRTTQS